MPQFIAGDTPATTAVSIFKKQTRREDFSSRRWFLPGQNRAWRYLRSKRPAPRKTRNCLTVFFAFVVVCILRKLSLEEMLGVWENRN
jgi:hypothetical protein